jgi:hypothetical protein
VIRFKSDEPSEVALTEDANWLTLPLSEKSPHAPGAFARRWKSSGSERASPPLISVPVNIAESVIAAFAGSVGRNPAFFCTTPSLP